jgi:hypothetical protein
MALRTLRIVAAADVRWMLDLLALRRLAQRLAATARQTTRPKPRGLPTSPAGGKQLARHVCPAQLRGIATTRQAAFTSSVT